VSKTAKRRNPPKLKRSERRKVVKCCDKYNKVSFDTKGQAEAALLRIQKDVAQAVAPPSTYPTRCYQCAGGKWHLTRSEDRRG
jgi:hypothetical protein